VKRETVVIVGLLAALASVAIGRGVLKSDTVLLLAAVIPSIILHEVSHGAVALLFGDDTAKRAGRLTLNPIKHIDPFGTLILPALLSLSGFGAFGYAKPVPVNVSRLRSPRNQGLLVSLAGPAVNVSLAGLTVLWVRNIGHPAEIGLRVGPIGYRFLFAFGLVNVILAVFNLLPVPPLDGSALVERLLPEAWWPGWLRFRQYSMPILLVAVLLLPGLLARIFNPAVRLWLHALTG
jgi:Zn-dependent protease